MTETDRDAAGFLRKICEEPYEDTHRLAFADWLEENGHAGRAELIRDQIGSRAGSHDIDLLDAHWEEWFPGVTRSDQYGFGRDLRSGGVNVVLANGNVVTVANGFVFGVRFARLASYLLHACSRYWSRQPVLLVQIADRATAPGCGWSRAAVPLSDADWYSVSYPADVLPQALFDRLPDYERTWHGATEALSTAAVGLGRELAGLPPQATSPMFQDAARRPGRAG